MNRMVQGCLALGALLVATWGAPAAGLSLQLAPGSAIVHVGDSVDLDVIAGDFGDAPGDLLSGFDLDFAFDPGVLGVVDVVLRVGTGDGFCAGAFDCGTGPGAAEVFGFASLPDDDLRALQMGAPLRLATLTFRALAPAATSVDFASDGFFPFVTGRQVPDSFQDDAQPCFPNCTVTAVLGAQVSGASLTILPGAAVPLPGTGPLVLLAGVLALAGRRRTARS
jgi:hypothetical protein